MEEPIRTKADIEEDMRLLILLIDCVHESKIVGQDRMKLLSKLGTQKENLDEELRPGAKLGGIEVAAEPILANQP